MLKEAYVEDQLESFVVNLTKYVDVNSALSVLLEKNCLSAQQNLLDFKSTVRLEYKPFDIRMSQGLANMTMKLLISFSVISIGLLILSFFIISSWFSKADLAASIIFIILIIISTGLLVIIAILHIMKPREIIVTDKRYVKCNTERNIMDEIPQSEELIKELQPYITKALNSFIREKTITLVDSQFREEFTITKYDVKNRHQIPIHGNYDRDNDDDSI
jgi:hypothetical protein